LVGLWVGLAGEPDAAARAAKSLAANPGDAVPFLKERLRRAGALEAPYARLITELDDDRFETRERAARRLEGGAAGAEFALRFALEGRPSAELRRRAENLLGKLGAARAEQIGHRIAELEGDPNGEASRQLRELGEAAEPALRRALQRPPFPVGRGQESFSPRARWRAQQILDRLKEPGNLSLPLNPRAVVRAVAVLEEVGTAEARRVLEELAGGAAEARVTREAKDALQRLKRRDKSSDRR
jgi:hypothetical protein